MPNKKDIQEIADRKTAAAYPESQRAGIKKKLKEDWESKNKGEASPLNPSEIEIYSLNNSLNPANTLTGRKYSNRVELDTPDSTPMVRRLPEPEKEDPTDFNYRPGRNSYRPNRRNMQRT